MPYLAYKDISLDGTTTRHYVISPAGDVVCTTHAVPAAKALAQILNTHQGTVYGTPVMAFDWALSNQHRENAA